MAVTQEQVDAAYNAREAARTRIERAEAALAAARPFTPAAETAKAEVDAAKGEYSRANAELSRVSNQFNRENPNTKPTTEAELKARAERLQREKNQNDPTFGLGVTDKERYEIERGERPRPARTDSPVQIQTANNQAQSNAETGRHNRQTEAQAAVNAQREALVSAGTLYNNTREQVSRENQNRVKSEQDNIAGTVGAATTLVDARTKMRGQDIDAQKTRSAFVQDVLTTAMPAVVQLMLKTPKGSPAAANFLKAFLTMASEAYRTAQLGNIPPPIDMNSPEMITLTRRAGYAMPDQLPSMPTSNQISQQTVQATAVGGFPVPGYQAPIGVGAAALPEAPGSGQPSQTRNGAGVDPLAEAAQSPEGQAILQGLKTQVGAIEEKKKRGEPLTPQEEQMLNSAKVSYNEQIRQLAAKRQQQIAQRGPADDLKDEVRSTLINGDPNQKLKLMALASTAIENQRAGKPLSPSEVAILANLDPQDLQIITQNMTPEVRSILTKHQQGQPVTPEERKRVETAVVGTTEGVKARPVQPAAVPSTPVQTTPQQSAPQAATPAASTPPGLPPGAPPMESMPGVKNQVLIKRPDGSMYWQNGDYVQATDNVIYDPQKKSEMPTPLEGPVQAKVFSSQQGPLPEDTTGLFSGASDMRGTPQSLYPTDAPDLTAEQRASFTPEVVSRLTSVGTDLQRNYNMPRELPTLFGPQREPDDMIYDNFPTVPSSPMPTLFAPDFLQRDQEDENDWWA